jgi:hypothetical protein
MMGSTPALNFASLPWTSKNFNLNLAFRIENDYYDHNADSAEAANEHADMDSGRGEG